MEGKKLKAISLFSSSGIGDLGLRANGIKTEIACEIIQERLELFSENFKDAKCIGKDIWVAKDEIVELYKSINSEPPFLVLATPPCQGMSSNGMGKILSDIRKGIRPDIDERNRLIIPAIEIIKLLKPEWVIFENVANMTNTIILDYNDRPINIIDFIYKSLGDDYEGHADVIDCADYGVPQNRKRLITILTRNRKGIAYLREYGSLLPTPTHSKEKSPMYKPWRTVRDAIGHLPKLEAVPRKNCGTIAGELHKVPLLDSKKLFWVSNTKEGDTAFNNQCVNPNCLYNNNTKHGAKHNHEGINKFNESTPIYCEKCGNLLPRPWVEDKATGEKRLMKGYVSAYKRMKWDEPASTLTQNFQYACSDNKLHPEQNRVLSLLEASIIQTIDEYGFKFAIEGKLVKDGLIRDTIGESIPPKVIDMICANILRISQD
jgi:DNA (cytosine-5)-methyltransferase 1